MFFFGQDLTEEREEVDTDTELVRTTEKWETTVESIYFGNSKITDTTGKHNYRMLIIIISQGAHIHTKNTFLI